MRKGIFVSILALISFCSIGCRLASPDAGHQVVWVEKPLFFGHGGVDADPVTTGMSYGAITSDPIDVNMLPQRFDIEFDDMMTKSGVPVSFHVVATCQVTDAVKLVKSFGADKDEKEHWGVWDGYKSGGKTETRYNKDEKEHWGFWDRNIDQPVRTAVRDAVKRRDMQEMAIDQSAADEVGQEVAAAIVKIIQQTGVPLSCSSVNVGRVNPPDAIKNQRVETAAQEQRAITEQQRKLAEDQRKAAEHSRAAADNAYREEMQLSPAQFIQLEQIKMQEKVCASSGNCMFFSGGNVTPIINPRH